MDHTGHPPRRWRIFLLEGFLLPSPPEVGHTFGFHHLTLTKQNKDDAKGWISAATHETVSLHLSGSVSYLGGARRNLQEASA